MSMPSDVNPDISEAVERADLPPKPPRERLSTEQRGWLVAAIVAFLGVAYIGPAVTRFRQRPTLKERLTRRLQEKQIETRHRARAAGTSFRKRMRRLGGGTLRR